MEATELLRNARTALRWSQQQAADAAGLTVQHWGQVERGKERGGDKTLARMALAVRVTPEQLEQAGRDGAADELRQLIAEGHGDVPSTDVDDIAILRRILTKLAQDEVRWFVQHADLLSRLRISAPGADTRTREPENTEADETSVRRAAAG